jgi:DNA-directed RNA polymerase subunit H (RpoH/RPB5)
MDAGDSETVSKVYTARVNLLSLLERRGFDVSEYNEFSINQVGIMMQNGQLDLLLTDSNGKKIFVKYHLTKPLRQNNVVDMIDDFFFVEDILTKADDLLIISKDELNDSMRAAINTAWSAHKIYIAVIPIKRLLFNILEHHQVPYHETLSAEDASRVLTEYNITNVKQLPEISRYDPVAQAIGLRPMNMCKIIRSSKTSVSATYYRYCV